MLLIFCLLFAVSEEEALAEAAAEVRCMYTRMAGCIQPHVVFPLADLFHHSFSSLFDRVVVEETNMQKLKRAVQTAAGPVFLLPTHRSYMVASKP